MEKVYTVDEALEAIKTVEELSPVLARLELANRALEEAVTFNEVEDVRDKVAAIESYMRRQKCGVAAISAATTLKFRAERRLGELLNEMPKNEGTRGQLAGRGVIGGDTASPPIHKPTYEQLGIKKKAASRYQQVASVPADVVEKRIEEAAKRGESVTVSDVLRLARKEERPKQKPAPDLPAGKFSLVYADPPWRYEHCIDNDDSVENHYTTLPAEELFDLRIHDRPVTSLFGKDCVLFLWTTSPKLAEAVAVLQAWGFRYRSCAVWDKGSIIQGYYFRQQHELLLIGVKGQPGTPLYENRPPSIMRYAKGRHSEKPAEVRGLIEAMYPEHAKIELFAREQHEGWTCWGNEA